MLLYTANSERILLHKIVQNREWHARFLNTLSLMELCGAQRLARAMLSCPQRTFLLEHVAEEYRHAYFLRRLANKVAERDLATFDEENVFCHKQSSSYIKSVDRRICISIKHHAISFITNIAYLLTTLVIEQRALPFYTLYQQVIEEHRIPISLKSLITEEEHHLSEINQEITDTDLPTDLVNDCLANEKILFDRWLSHVTAALNEKEQNRKEERTQRSL
jgi:rubrerythrin